MISNTKISNTNAITDLDIYNHFDNIERPDLTCDFIVDQEKNNKILASSATPSMIKIFTDNISKSISEFSLSQPMNEIHQKETTSTPSMDALKPKPSIFSVLNHTLTHEGHYCFKELLETPHSDRPTLSEKQSLVIKMYKNPGNISIIRQALKTIASLENHVAWIWGKHNQETLDYIEKLFFSFKIFNRKTLLDFHTGMEVYVVPLSTIIVPIITFCVTNYLLGSPTSVLEFIRSFLRTTIESYRFILTLMIGNESISKYGAYLITLLYIVFYVYKMYVTFNQSYKLYCQHNMIRSYFIKVHKFANAVMEIYQNDLFVKNIKQPNNGADNITLVSEALLRIIKVFDASKYTSGYCLLLWKNRHLHMKDISVLQWYCGRIDAWSSLITMMKSMTSDSTDAVNDADKIALTIPRFQWRNILDQSIDCNDNDKSCNPMVSIKGMWHPCLSKGGHVVKNNIHLGNGNPNNIILTGPNAAGKSTLLKSLTLNVYMAHTIGVVCCDDIALTPMAIINTYMNIPDHIGKESLFEAEMNRSLQQLKCIENAQMENKYVFSVMDEIFTGTNYHEGVAGAYAVCKKLHQFKNSINVVSTHFSFLTDLEQEYPDSFKNYRMDINLPLCANDDVDGPSAKNDVDGPLANDDVDGPSANDDKDNDVDGPLANNKDDDELSANDDIDQNFKFTKKDNDAEYDSFEIINTANKQDDFIIIDNDESSDTYSTCSKNMYTYKIKPGINQHKIALNLLKGKGFPIDVVQFSNDAIEKINQLSSVV